MSTPNNDTTEGEFESKRKKVEEGIDSSKVQITDYFKVVPKISRFLLALKKSIYSSSAGTLIEVDLKDLVTTTKSKTYLYLVVNVPPDKDYKVRHRMVLSRLFLAMKSADLDAVIIPCDLHPEHSDNKNNNYCSVCIDYLNKLPKSIIQLQKYFLKGRLKLVGGIVFMNFLMLHNEKVEDVNIDTKDSLQSYNTKMGKQRMQHYAVAKIGHILYLTPKIEVSH